MHYFLSIHKKMYSMHNLFYLENPRWFTFLVFTSQHSGWINYQNKTLLGILSVQIRQNAKFIMKFVHNRKSWAKNIFILVHVWRVCCVQSRDTDAEPETGNDFEVHKMASISTSYMLLFCGTMYALFWCVKTRVNCVFVSLLSDDERVTGWLAVTVSEAAVDVVVWPTMSCFTEWLKCDHVTLITM